MEKSPIAFAGSIPKNYDAYLGPMLFEPYAQDLASRVDPPSINTSVLEIACGTGRVTKHLCRTIPQHVQLYATDLNKDMLEIAKHSNQSKNILWQMLDAQDLAFENGIFDLVVCEFGFMFMPDKAKAFAEAYRVLRKDGHLLFNTWDKIEHNELMHLANTVISSFFPDAPPLFFHIPFSFFDIGEIRSFLNQAGFSGIKIDLLKKTAISPSAKDAAIGIVEGSPIVHFINEKAPSLLEPIRKGIEKEIGLKYGTNPLKASMQAWVVEAIKP